MKSTTKKRKSHMAWSWVIIISFFILGILDFRFGVLGFICMSAPLYHAVQGRGKAHCSKYCPRGSFLGKFLDKISLGNTLPAKFRSRKIKHGMLILMITLLTFSLSHAEPTLQAVGFILFRFMFMWFIVGILMGVIFKPRTWCQVCPMGHAAALTAEVKKKQQQKPKTGLPVN